MPCDYHRVLFAMLRKNGYSPLNDPLIVLQWCAHPKNKKYGQDNVIGPIPPISKRLYCDGVVGEEDCPVYDCFGNDWGYIANEL